MITPGAMARVVRDTPDLSGYNGALFRQDTEFTVEDYIPAEESEDGKAFYYGSTGDNINNVVVAAEDVIEVRSLEEMRARTIPTPAEVLTEIGSNLMGFCDGFSITGSDTDIENNSVYYEATADNGLDFSFTITLTELERNSF